MNDDNNNITNPLEEQVRQRNEIQTNIEILDRFNSKIRAKLKQRTGLTYEAARKLTIAECGGESLPKIYEEIFNEMTDDYAKENPLLAAKLRSNDPSEREEGIQMLDEILNELRSPD